MATIESETIYTEGSPNPVREVVTAVVPEHSAVTQLEEVLREVVPAEHLDEGRLEEMKRTLASDIEAANLTEVPERRETVLAVQLAECFCCGAPVYADGETACHTCMGATLRVAEGFAIPEEVGAPKRGHKWVKCKACNRRARRGIKAVIRSERRGKNVGKQLKKKARARASK